MINWFRFQVSFQRSYKRQVRDLTPSDHGLNPDVYQGEINETVPYMNSISWLEEKHSTSALEPKPPLDFFKRRKKIMMRTDLYIILSLRLTEEMLILNYLKSLLTTGTRPVIFIIFSQNLISTSSTGNKYNSIRWQKTEPSATDAREQRADNL